MQSEPNCPVLPWLIEFHSSEKGQVLNNQISAAFADNSLQHLSQLSIKSKPSPFVATRIICTLPPQATCHTLQQLMSLGMAGAIIPYQGQSQQKSAVAATTDNNQNKKKNTLDTKKASEQVVKVRSMVEEHSKSIGRVYNLALGVEMRGPVIRIGSFYDSKRKELFFPKGTITKLTTNPEMEECVKEDMIFVDYQKLHEIIQPGDAIYIENGSVKLSALEIAESIVKCIVEKAGKVFENSQVHLPNVPMDLQLPEVDKDILKFAIQSKLDFLVVSSVSRQGLQDIQQLLSDMNGCYVKVMAKIENEQAVNEIDHILKYCDAICIDCGKLMTEIPKEKIFIIQKSIIAKANIVGKPVWTTLMVNNLLSLSKSEICDVANFIMDGGDGLFIPQSASVGEAVKQLSAIAKEAESAIYHKNYFENLNNTLSIPVEPIYSIAIGAIEASLKAHASAIIAITCSGRTGQILSRFRPRCPIIAITRYARVARQLNLHRSIDAILYLKPFGGDFTRDIDDRIQLGMTYGKCSGYIRPGDAVVTISASRPEAGIANCVKIVYASDFDGFKNTKPSSH